MRFCNSSIVWSETHSIDMMVELENSDVTYPEQVKCYLKQNSAIIGDGIRKEIDGERERIAKTIAENLGTEMRTVNILSVRLPALDLELERKKIKKEMKMNKKAKKVYTEKEYSIHGPGRELDIQRSINIQAMENKQNEIIFGPRSHEPNREDTMKTKARPETEKETSVPGPWDSGQNPQFENNVQANSMVNEKKQINSFTSQQPQTTARRHSTAHLYLQKVPRDQVSSKNMVQSMPARREAVCDFTSDIHYQGKTQARVIFKRFGEDFESGNVRLAAQVASTSNMKRFLSLKSLKFNR